jgi:hypothetical protein
MPRVKEIRRPDCPECADRLDRLAPAPIPPKLFDEHGRLWDAPRLCATLVELVNDGIISPEQCNRAIRSMAQFAPRAEGLDLLLLDDVIASRIRSCLAYA